MASSSPTFTVLSLFLVCLAVHQVWSCSCMPSHTQDQYCRADFVIRAKVVDSRLIYEDPPRPPTPAKPTDLPEVDTDAAWTTEASDDTVTNKQVTVEEEEKEEEMEEGEKEVEEEKEIEEEKEVEKDFNNEIFNIIPERLRRSILPLPPYEEVKEELEILEERMPIAKEWKVRVSRVFKGQDFIDERTTVELLTAPMDSLCGITYLSKGIQYVFSGRYYDNILRINSCGLLEDYHKMSSRQKQGLKGGYTEGCAECRIIPCFSFPCRESNDSCPWYPFQDTDCESQFSRCLRKKSGKCGWHSNKQMAKCQASKSS
ncbi:metalloproteinase inhibitor 3-like [Glandiceps talaboti]